MTREHFGRPGERPSPEQLARRAAISNAISQVLLLAGAATLDTLAALSSLFVAIAVQSGRDSGEVIRAVQIKLDAMYEAKAERSSGPNHEPGSGLPQ